MRLYNKKFLKQSIDRQAETRQETRDGVVYDIQTSQRLCRVKVQGTNELIIAHYPENWEQNPFWLKPGNPVRIMHTGGIRGRIEVIGHGLAMPTGVTLLPIAGDADIVTGRMRLRACDRPRMAVLVMIGTYRIGGVSYTADAILLGSTSPYLLEDGGQIDKIAGCIDLNAAPAAGQVRYDLISVGTDGVFDYTAGTAVATDPVMPTVAANHTMVGWILVRGGTGAILQSDINILWYSDIGSPETPGPAGAIGMFVDSNAGTEIAIASGATQSFYFDIDSSIAWRTWDFYILLILLPFDGDTVTATPLPTSLTFNMIAPNGYSKTATITTELWRNVYWPPNYNGYGITCQEMGPGGSYGTQPVFGNPGVGRWTFSLTAVSADISINVSVHEFGWP